MRYLRVGNGGPEDDEAIREAARILKAGGLIVLPTDTLYGLAADPHHARAVERLFALKKRPLTQAMPLLAADLWQVEARTGPLGQLPAALARAFWPGPLTIVVDAWPGLAPGVDGGTGGAGIRVPAHVIARALAREAGTPLIATSANLSGELAANEVRSLAPAITAGVDLVLDAGPTPGGQPSTIVDARGTRPVLIRPGVVPWDRVLEFVRGGRGQGQ